MVKYLEFDHHLKKSAFMHIFSHSNAQMLKGTNSVAGIFASSPITQPSEFTAGKEFLAKYKAAYNSQPAYAGHYTHDATFALAAAIRKAESAIKVGISGSVRRVVK